jgi:hypothetical protein
MIRFSLGIYKTVEFLAGCQWPGNLATQEAEIRRTAVQSQPKVLETLSQKNPSQRKGWWSGSRYFKPHYHHHHHHPSTHTKWDC